jgi:hypothetical protein
VASGAGFQAATLCLALVVLTGCAPRIPDFSRRTGIVELPAGILVLHREIVLPEGARNLEIRGSPSGSTLQAAADFHGRALIYSKGATNLRLTGFRIDGRRAVLQQPIGLPPSGLPFVRFYRNNGIVIENATRLTIRGISFREVPNYPVLVSASSGVRIDSVRIEDCGSLSPAGRNNASGGILLEEGTRDFEVRQCTIRRVRGNAIWTHSNYGSPRNVSGIVAQNTIEEVARDAIQVGHASNVRVENNTGREIGYPRDLVDMAGYAVPAAIDTAGNVDKSVYAGNHFEDINGKCMDLDGFHDGEIRGNSCISRKSYDEYPYAQYGIVFNNSNPDMEPVNVTIIGNLIDGAGYGGIFLIGSGHVISGNRLLGLNRNRCTGDMRQARCNYAADQPALLHSGIYLGSGADRLAHTAGNRIQANEISGFAMEHTCVAGAPGVSLAANVIAGNRCIDTTPRTQHTTDKYPAKD